MKLVALAVSAIAVAVAVAASGAHARSPGSAPAPPGTRPAAEVPEVPMASFRELCNGHVTGAPKPDGAPGPHIEWIAYSSPATGKELAKRYAALLAGASHEMEESCDLWRFDDRVRHIWQVCPVGTKSPASECASPPAGTKSILVVSLMVGGD